MKQVNLSLETAKEMYNSNIYSLKQLALENYTEEELTKKEFPKEWKKYYGQYGLSYVINNEENANTLVALAQLITLRDLWWKIDNDWKPIFNDSEYKYCIFTSFNIVVKSITLNENHIILFRTREIRDEFYETFKDLLEKAKPLL